MHRVFIAILSSSILASNVAAGKTSYSCHMSVADTMSNCCCYPERSRGTGDPSRQSSSLSGDFDTCKLPDCQGKESENSAKTLSHGSCCTLSYETVEAAKGVFPKTNLDVSLCHLKNLPSGGLTVWEKTTEHDGDLSTPRPSRNEGSALTIPVYILTHALLC